MTAVKEAEIIRTAGAVELQRARARITELEAQLAATRKGTGAIVYRSLLAFGFAVAFLAAAAACAHRLLMWGWP